MAAVSLDPAMEAERLRRDVAAALEKVDAGKGILILTDMFGGTPSNISLSFLKEGRVDVVTGVNLPMLIHGASRRSGKTIGQLAEEVQQYGRRSISQAGQILKKDVGAAAPPPPSREFASRTPGQGQAAETRKAHPRRDADRDGHSAAEREW